MILDVVVEEVSVEEVPSSGMTGCTWADSAGKRCIANRKSFCMESLSVQNDFSYQFVYRAFRTPVSREPVWR